MNLLVELHYLPCLAYIKELLHHDTIYLEAYENYQKQSYRNRCRILMTNKVELLTVPVLKGATKVFTKDIKIDYTQDWRKVHWRGIASAYGKTPYFEHLSPFFENAYDKKHVFLWDLNLELLTICLKLLGIQKNILFTSEYNKVTAINVQDINDKRSYQSWDEENRNLTQTYSQAFGREFVPNLSIVDLLFNEGPYGKKILEKPADK